MRRVMAVLAVGFALSITVVSHRAAAQAPDGQAVYRQHCRTCHGTTGTPTARMVGLYPKLKTLSDSALMASLTVDSITNVVRKGRGDMKPLADKLTADEIAAVAQYVRTLPGVAHKP